MSDRSSTDIGLAIDKLMLQVSRLAWAVERALRSHLPSQVTDTLVACRRCGSMLVAAGDPKCGACGAEMEVPRG